MEKWNEAGNFKASERALSLSLLVLANSLLVQRRVGKYVPLGKGAWGMNATRQGCIDLLKKAAYEPGSGTVRENQFVLCFNMLHHCLKQTKKVSKIIYNIYNIFIS